MLSGGCGAKQPGGTGGVIQAFRDAGIPIGQVVTFEETDPAKQLGQQGQSFVAKADKALWEDQRLAQTGDHPRGGVVEVFQSGEDLKARIKYLETQNGYPSPYVLVSANAVVELDHDLTAEQVAQYYDAFSKAPAAAWQGG